MSVDFRKYKKGRTLEDVMQEVLRENEGWTRTRAAEYIRKRVPHEDYYQEKVIGGLKAWLPEAYVAKVAQGAYSTGGIPDVMCIYRGHYFGFEVKRAFIGKPTRLQTRAMDKIRGAGGTAAVVSWPEEAMEVIENYFGNKEG